MNEEKATITVEVTGEIDESMGEGIVGNNIVAVAMMGALESLREFKPTDRSEAARRYAVTITMMEQAYAYFSTWVLSGNWRK